MVPARGLVVDSPQDEGYPPTQLPPKNGGQGVEINRLRRMPRKQDKYATVLSVPLWISKILSERDRVVLSQLCVAMIE
jgi:hypothetical protein